MSPVDQHAPLIADVAVLGGGVCGLWTAAHLARPRSSPHSSRRPRVVLIERTVLGDAQTIASQGIIHGGIKYALTGEASAASKAIAEMPALWDSCLRGETSETYADPDAALLDLRGVRVLSNHQYLWSTGGLVSRIAAAAAGKVIRTGVSRVPRDSAEWMTFVGVHGRAAAAKSIDVYRVDESILNAASVVAALKRACVDAGVVFSTGSAVLRGTGVLPANRHIELSHADGTRALTIDTHAVVLCAGSGNEELLRSAGVSNIPMQRRPLHMVMAKFPVGAKPPTLYGHCLAGSFTDKPRLTVTTHTAADGSSVWYLGGLLAEEGVNRSPAEQIVIAKREAAACVPWVDLDGTTWSTLRVDRAEGLTDHGKRPDQPVVRTNGSDNSLIAAWPTKLAFAPLVAARVRELLEPVLNTSKDTATPGLTHTSDVPVAPLPWDDDRGGRRWS